MGVSAGIILLVLLPILEGFIGAIIFELLKDKIEN